MRKNINKIVAFAIGISVISGSIMPVFAADTTQSIQTASTVNVQAQTNTNIQQTNGKAVLTLDEAVKSAISISDTLALDEKKINYQDKINDIKEKQDDFNNVSDDSEDFDNDTADINLKKAKQQADFDEDILRKKVTDKYNDIVTSQIKIIKATKELEVKNKKLEDAKLKQSLGITTSIDLKTTELEIQNLQNTKKSSENALKDSQYSFKVLTGKDLTQYSLEEDIKFEQLKIDGSVDAYLDNAIDSYLKYTEQLVKLNKDYYDKDYESDKGITTSIIDKAENDAKSAIKPSKPAEASTDVSVYEKYTDSLTSYNNTISKYTGLLASRLTYLNTKLSNYQSETILNQNKKNFKDQLKTCYTNILTSEDNINYYKKNIELNNEKLSNSKLKYDLGMMTESDYNTQVVSSQDLDIQLRNEIINYNKLKEQIQKPWIAFSSAQ